MKKNWLRSFFPKISKDLKGEFKNEVLYTNIKRSRFFSFLLIFLHVPIIIADYFNYINGLWASMPAYRNLFVLHFVLVLFLAIYLLITRSVSKRIQLGRVKQKYYVFEWSYAIFLLIWCAAISINDQFINRDLTIFVLGFVLISVLFILNIYQCLALYSSVFLVFILGLIHFTNNADRIQGILINTGSVLVLSWIMSRLFYTIYIQQFVNAKKLETAVIEKENNEHNLQLININLDRVIKERTKALSDTNEKLYNEITKRLQIEENLRANESKYRLLTDLSKDVIWTMDLNMNYTYISPSVKKMLGYTPEEFMEMDYESLFPAESFQLSKQTYDNELKRIENGEIKDHAFSYIIELQHFCKDGSLIWGEVNTSSICDEDGKLVGIHGITRDITDRKIAEEALKNSEEKYRLLTDNINDLVWCMDLKLNSTYTSPSIYKLLGITPEERKYISTKDILTPASYQNVVGILSETMGKIKRGEIDGKTFSRKIELEQIKKDGTVFWAETIVSLLYDKFENIIGIQGVTRDVSDRVRAEKTLKESEENFRILFENSPLGIIVSNLKGEIVRINPALLKMLGSQSADETMKINLLTFKPLIDAGVSELLDRAIKTGKELVGERKYTSIWEKTLYIFCHFKPMLDLNGKLTNIQIIVQDITERKVIERALLDSEEMYRLVVETANDVIYTLSLESIVTSVNSALERITGWKPEEVIGKSSLFFIHPDDVERSRNNHFSFLNNPLPETSEFRFLHKNRNYLDVEFSTAPLYKDGKLMARFGIGRNITERKLAEKALRESEERYRNLIENQGEGVGIVNTNEEFVFANPAAEEIFGVEKGRLVGMNLNNFVDLKQYSYIKLQTNLRRKGIKSSYEITITRPDKEQRDILLTATPFYEKEKSEISIFGIFRDITFRKKAEEALRKSEEKYRIIFENAKEGIFQTTIDGKYITANPALVKMYGFESSEELMKSRSDIATQTYVDPNLRQTFIKIMEETGFVKGFEYEIYKKDGSKLWVYEDANAVKDAQGNVLYFEGFVVDMTEKKRTEVAKKKEYDFIELSSQISAEFIKLDTSELNNSIIKALEIVVKHAQVSRGYVFLYNANKEKLLLSFEWAKKGASSLKKTLSSINPDCFNEFIYTLNIGNILEGHFSNESKTEKSRNFKKIMFSTGALSYIQLPLFISNELIGYIGFDSVEKNTEWTPDITSAFNLTGQLITHALERKLNDEQIKASLTEKEVLLKEIHHRVKNNLQVIISLLNLQANTISNEEIKEIFEESQDRIKAMAIIHEKLYQSKNFDELDFAGYIRNLADYLLHSYNIQGKNVIVDTETENIPIEIDIAVPLGLIINELVTNAFKYAFKKSTHGRILIRLNLVETSKVLLEVIDNGGGIPEAIDFRNTSSLGLQLVCSLVLQVEGTIELIREDGSRFQIIFPYKKAKA
jgi:PAS domain S-box-containing protein